jgi:hypothetical protein
LRQELPVGEEVQVRLTARGGVRSSLLRARVAWTGPTDDGRFATGLRFVGRLDQAMLQDLRRP